MELTEIEAIRASYPKVISKDQLYRICHISKSTALYLIQSGLIPSSNSGKKTRKYKINLDDVIDYLQQREETPFFFKPPENYYKGTNGLRGRQRRLCIPSEQMSEARLFFERKFERYDDVIPTSKVTKITGYSAKTVVSWYERKIIKCFLIKGRLYFPKEYLIEFILSDSCNYIIQKSKRHIALLEEFLSEQ